jgi:DNA primase
MDRHDLNELKNRIGLLEYLSLYHWQPRRRTAGGHVAGLCPLHTETRPSFWIHTRKNYFYCHGCGRGGDLIRLVQLYHGLSFPHAVAHLRRHTATTSPLQDAMTFYQAQLRRRPEAIRYLAQRGLHDPATLAALGIGYAPGACLSAHLRDLGYAPDHLRQTGLINTQGRDALYRRIVFPHGDTLYGRSIDADSSAPHRFLRAGKGGLFRWEWLQSARQVILAEGFFDVAALWQAGFVHSTCGGGINLNHAQFQQLITGKRTIWVAFDGDDAGQQAALRLSARLHQAGQRARRILLPHSHDPASYFAAGASAEHFRALLQQAPPASPSAATCQWGAPR